MFLKGERESVKVENVLFIDPGIGGTGWAFWRELDTNAITPTAHDESGVIICKSIPRDKSRETWNTKVREICAQMAGVMNVLQADIIVLEFPVLWASGKSQTACSRGDLFKLAYLIGGIGEVGRQQTIVKPVLVTVLEWKGQLPKNLVIARYRQKTRFAGRIGNHEGDAMGMGLSAQGHLK